MIEKKTLIPLFMEDVSFDGNIFDVIERIESLGYFIRFNTVFSKTQKQIKKKYYCAILEDKYNDINQDTYIVEYFSDKSLKHALKKNVYQFIEWYFKDQDSIVPTVSFSMNRAFNLNKPYNEIYK